MEPTPVKVNLEPLQRFREALAADLRGSGQGPVRASIKRWGRLYRTAMQERFLDESRGGGDWPPLAASTIAGRRAGRGVKGTAGAKKQTRAGAARRLRQQIAKHQEQADKLQRQITNAGSRRSAATRTNLLRRLEGHRQKIDTKSSKAAGLASMAGISILRDTGTLFSVLAPTFAGAPGALEEHIPFGVRVGYGGPGAHPGGKATVADIASFHQAGSGRLPRRAIIVATPPACVQAMAADMDRAIARMAAETGNGR